jgi:hypothetical protein
MAKLPESMRAARSPLSRSHLSLRALGAAAGRVSTTLCRARLELLGLDLPLARKSLGNYRMVRLDAAEQSKTAICGWLATNWRKFYAYSCCIFAVTRA